MILYLDFTNKISRIAAVNPRSPSSNLQPAGSPKRSGSLKQAGGAVWYSVVSGRSVVSALAAARKLRAFSGKPTCIVVAQGVPGAERDVSWSGIRSAVAAANALAFALAVPVVTMPLSGDEDEKQLANMVRMAARRAKKGEWASAAYNAEPNITQSKIGK